MPKVTIDGQTVEFEHGKLPYHEHGKPESLLDIALNFGVPLEHACGGNCACTTCHVVVKQGEQNLSEAEMKLRIAFLEEKERELETNFETVGHKVEAQDGDVQDKADLLSGEI